MRIVPKDAIQGAALATIMKKDGCTSVYILNDKEVYGGRPRQEHRRRCRRAGPRGRGQRGHRPEGPELPFAGLHDQDLGCRLLRVLGITANGAVQLYKDVSAAVPDAKLYGPDGVAESGFADLKEAASPPAWRTR